MKNDFMLVYCTCPAPTDEDADNVAQKLARSLVEKRQAACVNIVPAVESVYRWRGSIETDREQLLIIKTRQDRVDSVFETITALHPYELPELIAVPVQTGSDGYLAWMAEEL